MGFIGDIAGAIIGGNASKKAARAQVEMGEKGLAEMARQFNLGREDMAPWRQAGGQAIGQGLAMLQPGYDHTTSPGYDFRMDEGMRAIEGSAASKGMLGSGGTLKDLVRFGQGTAAADYGDQFNRTMAIAGGGQQAAQTGASLGAQYGRDAANTYGQMGNARASGYVGQANAWMGGINNFNDRLSMMAMGMGG